MEGRTQYHTPRGKNVPKQFKEMFEKESRKNSPKPSTSKEPFVPSQELPSERTMADTVSNSYLFTKDRPHLSLIANPLNSNSSFLYHCFDDNNSDVHMHDNREQQALGKLIKNYLVDNNEEDALRNPPPQVCHSSPTNWTERSQKRPYPHPIQEQPSFCLPITTRTLSPLQTERMENRTLSKLMSPSLKPEVYNSDPFGNNTAEREQLHQSIRAASQNYESALKTLENVIDRLSKPWPGRKKNINMSLD